VVLPFKNNKRTLALRDTDSYLEHFISCVAVEGRQGQKPTVLWSFSPGALKRRPCVGKVYTVLDMDFFKKKLNQNQDCTHAHERHPIDRDGWSVSIPFSQTVLCKAKELTVTRDMGLTRRGVAWRGVGKLEENKLETLTTHAHVFPSPKHFPLNSFPHLTVAYCRRR
jgi:hypothetical protein